MFTLVYTLLAVVPAIITAMCVLMTVLIVELMATPVAYELVDAPAPSPEPAPTHRVRVRTWSTAWVTCVMCVIIMHVMPAYAYARPWAARDVMHMPCHPKRWHYKLDYVGPPPPTGGVEGSPHDKI